MPKAQLRPESEAPAIRLYSVSDAVKHLEELIGAAYALTCPPDGCGDIDIPDEMMPLFYLLGEAKSFASTMYDRSEAAWNHNSYATKDPHPLAAANVNGEVRQ